MQILAVTGTFVPASGGAEWSLAETLDFFRQEGHEVLVLTRPPRTKEASQNWQRYSCASRDDLDQCIPDILRSVKPDVVFTQMLWSDWVLHHKELFDCPIVYFARTTTGNLNLSPHRSNSPDLVVANSHDTKAVLDSRWGCNSFVLHPVVRHARFHPRTTSRRVFHFMTNPVRIKGGELFVEMAKARPNLDFATIYGWDQLRSGPKQSDAWDAQVIAELSLALSKPAVSMSPFVDVTSCRNVRVLPVTFCIETVLAQVHVLLAPSQWREPLGRIVVEAAACGVPAIISRVGGMCEGPHHEDLVVPPGSSVQEWLIRIDSLQEPTRWREASECVVAQYDQYRSANNTELHHLLQMVLSQAGR